MEDTNIQFKDLLLAKKFARYEKEVKSSFFERSQIEEEQEWRDYNREISSDDSVEEQYNHQEFQHIHPINLDGYQMSKG